MTPGRGPRRWMPLAAAGLLAASPLAAALRFAERAAAWGIDFRHHHGGSGQRYMVETVCGGVVVFDYDGDGDHDLFFVDGGALPGYTGEPARSRLFRNEGGRFLDVTDRSGLVLPMYGCGGTAADVEADGDLDLFVTGLEADALFANRGDGTFRDVTAAAGVRHPAWSTAAAFADTDRDGDLDLYVADYVDFTLANHHACRKGEAGIVAYCQPDAYEALPDRFLVNEGNGIFREATAAAGLDAVGPGAGLGAVFADLDEDGWPDLYVANDQDPNHLFLNRGDGTFEDRSLLSGAALNDRGEAEAGMGVDAGDYDGDGRLDLVVTNFEGESNGLYRNLGGGSFADARFVAGIAQPSIPLLAFGVDLADFDHDADLDLVIANGHVHDNAAEIFPTSRYAQRNQLFENLGGGRFREVLDAGLDVVRVSRGLATGDLDGDGDLDIVVVNSNDGVEVYENLDGAEASWLLVDLESIRSAPFGVGARLALTAAGRRQVEEARSASSSLSQNAQSVHFGLGQASEVETLEVRWPAGRRQRFEGLAARRRIRLCEPGQAERL